MGKCPKCGYITVTRSIKQNDTYWGLCIEPMAEEAGCTPMEMHESLKEELLSKEVPFNTKTGMVFKRIVGSTTELTNREFIDYMERVKEIAVRVYGVVCKDPYQKDPSGEYS